MNFKLLIGMIVVIAALMLVLAFASIGTSNSSIVNFAIFIPLALFAFIAYKFGKQGIVAILYFLGVLFAIAAAQAGIIALIIGVVVILVATALKNIWKVKLTARATKN